MNIKMRKKERGFLILYDMIGREIFSAAFSSSGSEDLCTYSLSIDGWVGFMRAFLRYGLMSM